MSNEMYWLLMRTVLSFAFGVLIGCVYHLWRSQREHDADLHNLDERLLRIEREVGDGGELYADESAEYPIRFGKGA